MKSLRTLCHVALSVILIATAVQVLAADWPTYRADVSRSGAVDDQLPAQVSLQWTYTPAQPPWPAWPEPGRELNRLAFDHGFHCAVVDSVVYFGSSATGKVHALELATGAERWSFFTGGSVRFAPAVADGRVYVASDDGYLYCLSAADGAQLWRFRAGPRDEMIMGHERLISRWPLRSGCAVVGDTVYTVGGIFPSEGVYVYALSAEDGSVRWCNDTSGTIYMNQPHPGSQAMTGVAPQGPVMVHAGRLFVPTGRNVPAAYDLKTGELAYYHGAPKSWSDRWGGAWTMGVEGLFMIPKAHVGPDIEARYGESDPWPKDGSTLMNCADGMAACELPGKLWATVGADRLYAVGDGKLTAYDLKALKAGKAPTDCMVWQANHAHAYDIIRAGDALVVGGRGTLSAFAAADGKQLWQQEVGAQVRGIAAADGHVLASVDDGRVLCFGAEQRAEHATVGDALTDRPYPDDQGAAAEQAKQVIADTGINSGYCVVLGAADGRLAYELTRLGDFTVFGIESDTAKVSAAREALHSAGLYGTRVTIHQGELDALTLPPYMGNLVIVAAQDASLSEAYRVCRPEGGMLYALHGADKARLLAAGATATEILGTGPPVRVVRGKLPGAGEWTHQYSDAAKSACSTDRRARLPLQMLWFGEPGPERLVNRHWRASSPVAVDGRVFVGGQDCVIASDAYSGRELWSWELPKVGRQSAHTYGGNLAVQGDSLYVVSGDVCFRLSAATGENLSRYTPPVGQESVSLAAPVELELDGGENQSGSVRVAATDRGIEMTLLTRDNKVTNAGGAKPPGSGDSWELYFDFRRREMSGGTYGPGAFRLAIVPATIEQRSPTWAHVSGPTCPDIKVEGKQGSTGSETTLLVTWDEIGKLTGVGKPVDFGFAVTLNCSDDGKKVVRRVHKFADGDSWRLTTHWARMVLDEAASTASGTTGALLPASEVETKNWEHLAIAGDTVYGSLGAGAEASYVFALDAETGAPKWLYTAEESVSNNAIVVTDGLVVLLDRTPDARITQMKRRGEDIEVRYTLKALDAATGAEVWTTHQRISDLRALFSSQGVLVATGPRAMNAYRVSDGRMLWATATKTNKFPAIVDGIIYNEPRAYDLQTGEQAKRVHPLTGQEVGWDYARSYGCGSIAGAPGLLLFRSGTIGFCDLVDDSGIHNYGGVRAGCYVNAIAANGLVLVPCADAGCTCSYNFQTSVALVPADREEAWSVFRATGAEALTPLKRVSLNLGAPGDRRDEDDSVWLSFPRPAAAGAMKVAAQLSPAGKENLYRHNADALTISGTQRPWLYASGCTGAAKLSIATLWDAPAGLPVDETRAYTVRLHFADPTNSERGQRVFGVKVQGKSVLEGFDIVAEAGGARRALVKEVAGVEAGSSVDIELVPVTGDPILCAVEIIEE